VRNVSGKVVEKIETRFQKGFPENRAIFSG
jgi:hypothetical protein